MVGKILGGRYELLEKIGTGGMAIVYRAKCLLLNRIVAVKILRDDLDSSDEFLKRFNIEAQSAASLTNQHIVAIHDVGKDGNINYIVMEYVEGMTLKEYIKEKKVVEWRQAVRFAMGIADALAQAHKKHIIHRDIKPQNIIVTNNDDVKVTDFGIARVSSGATISVDGDVLGSVHYLSPEQARGGYVDERSDIYSLGVVLYEMLTGRVPFDGDTPIAVAMKQIEQPPTPPENIVSDIPESVSAIVLKAMCKETSGRYDTVEELYNDLSMVYTDPASVVEKKDQNDIMDDATKKMAPLKMETAVIDIATGKIIKETPADNQNSNKNISQTKEKKKLSKEDKKAVISAIITSVVIVLLLSFVAASLLIEDFRPFAFLGGISNEEHTVPDLDGMTYAEAEDSLKGTKFTLVARGGVKDGIIIEQYPKANHTVKGSKQIEVELNGDRTMSGDSSKIVLKDYRNKEYQGVESELKKLGLYVVISKQKSEDIAVDYIISQSPGRNSELSFGDTITLYVSEGVGDGTVTVPSFIGMTKNNAKKRIEQENLVVGEFSYEDSAKPKDTVVSQSIDPGTSANEKDVINLVLSNGKAPSSAVSSGKGRSLTFYLDDYDNEITIKLQKDGHVVFEKKIDPKKQPVFEYEIGADDNAKYEFFVDGKKVNG